MYTVAYTNIHQYTKSRARKTGISAIGFGAKLGIDDSFKSTSGEEAPKT
jgi:hypothetical protein